MLSVHPPQDVQSRPLAEGAEITWQYQLPDSMLSHNNGYPFGIWGPNVQHAMGVVFNLEHFENPSLELVDFAHFSKGKMEGPYHYRIHIWDMDSMETVALLDSLVAGDANAYPRFEIGVELGSIPAPDSVGIFIEGLSSPDDQKSLPAVMTDSSDLVPNTSFYCANTDDPFNNLYELSQVDANATNVLIDLWVNEGYGSENVLAKATAVPNENVASSSNHEGFYIYRGVSADSMQQIASVGPYETRYVDADAPRDSAYFYAVSAYRDTVISIRESVAHQQPLIQSIASVKRDDNNDFIPDQNGQKVALTGIVNSLNFSEASAYFLQHDSSGLLLYNNTYDLNLQVGDSIYVYGHLEQEMGLTRIRPDTISDVSVLSSGHKLDTLVLNLDEIGEQYEGVLTAVEGVRLDNPEDWPGVNQNGEDIIITTDDHSGYLYIDKETELDGWVPPYGDMIVVGVVSQSTPDNPPDNGYALQPRFRSDFMTLTGLNQNPGLNPDRYTLHQNYPNPFNPVTEISFSLPQKEQVTIEVYNNLGEKVRVLSDGVRPAGDHRIRFHADQLSSGLYYYRMEAGSFEAVRKMLLIR